MDRDFAYFAAASEAPSSASNNLLKISFMNFPFILTPAAKALGLYYDNRIRMYSERRQSIFNSVMNGQPSNPYLKVPIIVHFDDEHMFLFFLTLLFFATLAKNST